MRHIPLCLFVPFVLACGLLGPGEPTIQVQGTVTAADDGTPIIGALVRMFAFKGFSFAVGLATTDRSGRYALSLSTEGIGCREDQLRITISVGFIEEEFESLDFRGNSGVRCTDKPQTLDFQLERIPPLEPAGD